MSSAESTHVELCLWESGGVRLAIPSHQVREFISDASSSSADHDLGLALGLGPSHDGRRALLGIGAEALPCVLGPWVHLRKVAIAQLRRLPAVVREMLVPRGICGYLLDGASGSSIAYLVDVNALLSDAARKRA